MNAQETVTSLGLLLAEVNAERQQLRIENVQLRQQLVALVPVPEPEASGDDEQKD